MANKRRNTWMQMGFMPEDLHKIENLDQINCHATSVWLRALMLLLHNEGQMSASMLFRQLIGNHVSKRTIGNILIASGDFVMVDDDQTVVLTDSALEKYLPNLVRKNSHENEISCENSRTKSTPHTCVVDKSTSDREEKENKNTLPSFSHETQSSSSEPAAERVTQSWPKKPAELEAYRGELWHGYVCELFNQRQMQSWRETLMQQIYDKELVGLVERHWAETVMQFVYHLVTWPPSKGIWSIEDLKRTFHSYLRPNRAPSRELKAYLRQLEQQDTVKNDREQRFIDFMRQHFPHLLLMDDALTFEQFDQLRRQYGKQAVLTVLADMENDTSLERRSCFDTALQWLRHRHKS